MEKEMYTFSDFCEDRGILSREATDDLRHLRAMWDVYGEDYVEHCKDNNLEYERIR